MNLISQILAPVLELAPVRVFRISGETKMANYTNGAPNAPHSSTASEGRPPDDAANNAPGGEEHHTNGSHAHGYPDTQTGAIWQGELSERHRHALEIESAIDPEVIEARGYFTTNDRNLLRLHGYSKAQALTPALVMPLWNWEGQRCGVTIRHTIPRIDKNNKEVKYDIPIGSLIVLDVSPATRYLITDTTKPLVVTEGAKKADSAASRGLPAINLNGVWGFLSAGVPHPDWEKLRPYLRGRAVFIAYDSDVTRKRGVATAMRRLEGLLKSLGAMVKVVYLPDGADGKKTGLDDFFARGESLEHFYLLGRDLESVEETTRKRREQERAEKRAKVDEEAKLAGIPQIEVHDRNLPEITAELASALDAYNGTSPKLFYGATGLVSVTKDKDGKDFVKGASLELVQGVAGDAAAWVSTNENGAVTRVFPPRSVCASFMEQPAKWRNIPPLENIVNAPFFAPDGTLCDRTGYYGSAQTWVSLPPDFHLSDTTPTPENIEKARRIIDKALEGVAFADAASRAHGIAAMMQPVVRRMIPSATPIFLFDAPVQASGKSYTARLTILPHTTPRSMNDIKNHEEWEKSIFTAFMEGRTHLFFDNIVGRLDSPTLASYVTEPEKQQRILGINKTATVKTWGATWIATSNNASLSADAVSRIVKIRLDTGLETPESRQFTSDPETYIRENRGEVFGALLTLVNAWITAGKPSYTKQKHRFTEWSRIMGGILEVAGIDGFLDNLEAERENMAPERDAWREFVLAWFEQFGGKNVTAKELLEVAFKCDGLSGVLGEKDNKSAKRLGDFLSRKRDQIFADLQIQKAAEKSKHGVKWCLFNRNPSKKTQNSSEESFEGDAGDAGDTGFNSPHAGEKFKESQKDSEDCKNAPNKEWCEPVSPVSPVSPLSDDEELI